MIKEDITYFARSAMAEMSMPRIIAAALIGAGAIMVYRDILIAYDAAASAGDNLATVAASGAFIKVFLATGVVYIWNTRKTLGGFGAFSGIAACCVAAILFHAYSLVSAMDFAFAGRDKVVTTQGQTIEDRKRLEARYSAASARVQASSGARPVSDIEADVKKIEASLAAAAALAASEAVNEETHRKNVYCGDLCKAAAANKNAAIADQRTLVPRLEALSLELKGSRQAEQARSDMADIDAALAKLKTAGHRDPQAYSAATVLSGLGFNIDPENAQHVENVGLAKPVLLSLVNEFGATCAFLLGFAFWNSRRTEERTSGQGGGVAVATWAPTKPLPLPAPTPEEKTFREVRNLIACATDNKLVAGSGRKLSDHLEVPNSSLAEWLNRWERDGKIVKTMEGNQLVLSLPTRARIAARRELATA